MSQCPRCNCKATGENRLVTDSCGHSKCRLCLLADVADCFECKVPTEVPTAISAKTSDLNPPETNSDNHITITPEGYHCTVCKKSFRSRTQQYYHRACGNDMLKKFGCTQCNRRFSTNSHLKYHLNSHGKSCNYTCTACGKAFKQKLVLQRHMRSHKPHAFSCRHCEKMFHTQSALTAHALVHTSTSLPYQCDICPKQYLSKANLKQHQLKHDQNSIRHRCTVCSKSFLRQSTLKLHQIRHTKRARISCALCHKNFNDADALARHKKQHTTKQRYRCIQCDVTINRRDNMLRHLRSMHPGIEFDSGVEVVNPETSNPTIAAVAEPSTQCVRYNSVIKSVGNVEPVMLAFPQPEIPVEQPKVSVSTGVALPDKTQKENVKLYRKIILDLDNEEYSNELCNGLDMDENVSTTDVQQVALQEPQLQRVGGLGSSNFSERHWRKNFKYSYENANLG